MAAVQLEFARDDDDAKAALGGLPKADVLLATPDHFEGGHEVLSAIVTITTVTIPVIGALIREHIRAKRYLKVKVKGVEVAGSSLDEVEAFLAKLKDPG